MADGDLTTLARAKSWLGLDATATGDDALLTRLITASSRAILAYLGRDLLTSREYTEYFTAVGCVQTNQQLRNWPVTSVTSVLIDALTLSASVLPSAGNAAQPGYRLDPWDGRLPGRVQTLRLLGYTWTETPNANAVTYTAGYRTIEALTVPSSVPYEVTPALPWAEDISVVVGGATLTPVTGAPSAGEYQAPTGTSTVYVFNSAQAGQTGSITYSYTPPDVEEACWTLVGERYRYKDRIGQVSRSLAAQETTTYDPRRFTEDVRLLLNPYRHVVML